MVFAFPCRVLFICLGWGSLWGRTHTLTEGKSQCPGSLWTQLNTGEMVELYPAESTVQSASSLSACQVSALGSPQRLPGDSEDVRPPPLPLRCYLQGVWVGRAQ